MTNEFEEEVFELMDDLRGDNRVAVPDVGTIRRRAGRQQNRMRAATGAACIAVVAAIGGGVWSSSEESPATTETAGVEQDGIAQDLPAVGSDSAAVEFGGPDVIDSRESFGEWMIANRLGDHQPASVILTARDDDPATGGAQLRISAFPLDGSFEYFAVAHAECGPRVHHGMIEIDDDAARFSSGRLPDSADVGLDDVGYDCTSTNAGKLSKVLSSEFEFVPTPTGVRLVGDTVEVSLVLTDLEGNGLVDWATSHGATTAPPTIPVELVDIVTGEPEGGRGWQAGGSFTLQYDIELNCLYHDEPDNNGEPGTGGRVVIVWPADYSAVRETDGVAVLNMAGDEVARTGEMFQIAGGMRTGGSGHCDSIGEWVANGGPVSQINQEPVVTTTTIASSSPLPPNEDGSIGVGSIVMVLHTAGGDLELRPFTFCGTNFCADGVPREPYVNAGEVPGKLTFTFPFSDWEFSVHSGVDVQVTELEPMLYEMTITGPARTRTLNVSASGEQGSFSTVFRVDNVLG